MAYGDAVSRGDGAVEHVAVEDTLWGTGSKALIKVRYASESLDPPPEELVVKGCFVESMRPVVSQWVQNEAVFYSHFAPLTDIPLPPCVFAAADPASDQGIVILEDLRRRNVVFGVPQRPHSPDAVSEGLRHLAMLHGATWEGDFSALGPAASKGSVLAAQRTAMVDWFESDHWNRHIDSPRAVAMTGEFRDPERLLAGLRRKWEIDDENTACLCHGDCHIKNTYLTADGDLRLIDWQIIMPMNWAHDVNLMIVNCLETADRREHERDLVAGYVAALAAAGGPELDLEAAFLAYTQETLHSVTWGLCPEEMQPEADCALMCERAVAAASDHDVFAALRLR